MIELKDLPECPICKSNIKVKKVIYDNLIGWSKKNGISYKMGGYRMNANKIYSCQQCRKYFGYKTLE